MRWVKIVVIRMPVRAETKCPPRTARGWARGEEGREWTRMAEAPWNKVSFVVG